MYDRANTRTISTHPFPSKVSRDRTIMTVEPNGREGRPALTRASRWMLRGCRRCVCEHVQVGERAATHSKPAESSMTRFPTPWKLVGMHNTVATSMQARLLTDCACTTFCAEPINGLLRCCRRCVCEWLYEGEAAAAHSYRVEPSMKCLPTAWRLAGGT